MGAFGEICAKFALVEIKDQFFIRISLSFGTPGLSLVTNLGYRWCFQNIFNNRYGRKRQQERGLVGCKF